MDERQGERGRHTFLSLEKDTHRQTRKSSLPSYVSAVCKITKKLIIFYLSESTNKEIYKNIKLKFTFFPKCSTRLANPSIRMEGLKTNSRLSSVLMSTASQILSKQEGRGRGEGEQGS